MVNYIIYFIQVNQNINLLYALYLPGVITIVKQKNILCKYLIYRAA